MVEVFPSSYAYNGVTTIPEDSPVNDVSRVAAAAVAARVLMGANLENRQMSREEHSAMMQELGKKRAGWRTPRRGWSSTESPAAEPVAPNPTPAVSSPMADNAHHGQLVAERHHPRNSLASQHQAARRPAETQQQQQQQPPSADQHGAARPRPPLPPPRRSYSVMDYEPPSATHRPSVRMAITDLPAELHFVIFDFLDPIDSTCLGLTNSHFYTIHRRMHGSVPLSSRRSGPNDLEWAWRGAGPLVHPQPDPAAVLAQQRAALPNAQALERLRVKGQVYCRKCGVSRCELHRHLREWMASSGKNLEYCSVTCRYGPQAPEGAKEFCHLRSPKKPHRCGRHASKAVSGTQTPGVLEPQQRV